MNGIDEHHRVVESVLYIWKSGCIVLWNVWESESECLRFLRCGCGWFCVGSVCGDRCDRDGIGYHSCEG